MEYRLSKSRITEYLQCPKRLYLGVHHPELKTEMHSMQARFEAGHQIGDLARQLYPEGILIGTENNDLRAALEQTQQSLREYPDKPLFEATFQHGGILIRADLMIPVKGGYRMIEVKSSTEVKDYHLPDCAIQSWVIESSGTHLSGVSLMHVDNGFVYRELDNYQGLFKESDISEAILPLKTQISKWVNDCQHILEMGEPEIGVGDQCRTPFDCPFIKHCSIGQPEYPVTLLPSNMGKRGTAALLKSMGYEDLRQVPAGVIENTILEKIRRVTLTGEPELDESVYEVMAALPYPRYYLDFETIQFAIPIWLDTRPYQQLPFQWSCHIEYGADIYTHREFLNISSAPPMREFAERLIEAVGKDGPILVYNQGFEMSRIRELAMMFPDLADALAKINDRIVDLMPIAKQYYYHPAMKGSWSIKSVLPTIAEDLDYAHLEEVRDGGMAQTAFLEAINPNTTHERKEVLRKALLRYCELDTLAMFRLAMFFSPQSDIPEFLRKVPPFGQLEKGIIF